MYGIAFFVENMQREYKIRFRFAEVFVNFQIKKIFFVLIFTEC